MSNLHQLSTLAKQRKKRTLWRNLVVCFAALVVFCTTYALILPAITMEQEGYSCGLQEHTHTPDCYRLTCGKQEAYTHTHTKPDCYDADGNLTCTLKQQTLHRHTPDCYSKSQPICGLAEAAPHAHEDACYTEGELTCTLAETQGHTHGQDCYPAEFTPELICGQQELPEHRHTAACYTLTCQQQEHTHTESCISSHQAFLNSIQEATQEATQPETVTEPQEVTQPEAVTEPQVVTQPEAVTEPQVVTQPEDVTQPEEATEPKEPTQEEEPQAPVMLLARTAPAAVAENAGNTGPVNLVDVATSLRVSSNSAEYVTGENINGQWVDGAYRMTFNLEFDVETAGEQGDRHIIDKNGNSVSGTVFTYNLGKAELGRNVAYGTKYEFKPTLGNSTYHFVDNSDGTITVVIDLDDAYVKADNSGDIHGIISVAAIVGKEDGKDDGSVEHDTEGNIKIKVDAGNVKYPDNETNKGRVEVSKTGSFTFEGDKLLYTVVVSSGGKGTPGPVTILDTFNFDGAALDSMGITGPTDVKLDGADYTNFETSSDSTGKKNISMTLPQMDKTEKHTITYVFTVANRPETSTPVKNKVHVESKPEGEGKPAKAEREITVTVPDKNQEPQISLSKSRPWTQDDTMVIPWTIKFNDTRMDITGKVLEDSYTVSKSNGETETFPWDFNGAISTMTVKVNGAEIPEDQFAQHFTVQENGSLKFTGTEETPNTNAYEITYYMPTENFNSQWGVTSVKNKAKVGELEATADDWKSNNNSVQKSSLGVEAAENGQVRMKWKTDINVTNVGFRVNDVIHDNTNPGNSTENLHYFDRDSIRISYNGITWTEGVDYNLKFYDRKDGAETTGNATYMQVVLLKNITPQGGYKQDLLTMEYTTFAESHEAKTYKNTATFYNTAGDAQQEVVPDSIIKADGNGITGTTKVENFNGELTWKITAKIGDITKTKTVTVTDALPSNVEVRKLSVVSKLANGADQNADLTIAQDGTISGENLDFTFSGTCQKNEQGQNVVTLTATRKDGKDIEANSTVTLNLDCCLAPDFVAENDSVILDNTAEGKTDKGAIGNATHTQEWTKKKENVFENALSKKLITTPDGHNYLEYEVQINPEGKDLQPDSAEVYLVDDFSYNPKKGEYDLVFELVRDSVKLYNATLQADGTLAKEGDALTAGWRMVLSESDPTGDFPGAKITKTMRLAVPDGTPLILEYRYELTGHKEGLTSVWLEATNRAYFLTEPSQGSGDQSIGESWSISGTSGGLITDRHIKIVKVDESNSKVVIPGTEFTLQEWKDGAWSNVTTVTQPLTTGPDGTLTVDGFGDEPEDTLHYNVLYRLIETKAAPGYLLDAANPPTVEFYYHNDSQDVPEGYPAWDTVPKDSAVDLSQNSATHYITNKAESAQFSVKKLWKYEGGAPVTNPPEATFQLWQIATEKQQDVVVNDPLAGKVTVTVAAAQYSYGDSGPGTPYEVPKGTVLTVRVKQTGLSGFNPTVHLSVPNNNDVQITPTIRRPADDPDAIEFDYEAKYSVVLWVRTGHWDGYPTFTCTYPGQSTGGTTGGSTGGTTPTGFAPEPVGTITLNADNNWTWNSEGYLTKDGEKLLVHGTKDGKEVWYSYYVCEIPDTSYPYAVSYSNKSGNGYTAITSGTITVTNTLPPPPADVSVTVNKTWAGLDNWADLEKVNFKLIRRAWEHEPTEEERNTPENLAYDADLSQYSNLELVGEYILTKEGGWTWSKSDLPGGADGKYYTYFVVEQPGEYTVTYSPQVHEGTITVTNTTTEKPTEIQVNKQWFNHLDEDITASTTNDSVEFKLYRIAKVGDGASETPTLVGTYQVTRADSWTWKSKDVPGLDLLAMEYKDGQRYTYSYSIQEIVPENAGYTATYWGGENPPENWSTVNFSTELTPIQSGTLVIRNTLDSPKYELPQTGGTGTAPLRLAGLTLALTAACLLHRKRKTRPQ